MLSESSSFSFLVVFLAGSLLLESPSFSSSGVFLTVLLLFDSFDFLLEVLPSISSLRSIMDGCYLLGVLLGVLLVLSGFGRFDEVTSESSKASSVLLFEAEL